MQLTLHRYINQFNAACVLPNKYGVGIATGYGLGDWVQIPAALRFFSSPQSPDRI
jgi:hypothetical protein